jgi:hypothetical protein
MGIPHDHQMNNAVGDRTRVLPRFRRVCGTVLTQSRGELRLTNTNE